MDYVTRLWQHQSVRYVAVSAASIVGFALAQRLVQLVKDRFTPLRFFEDTNGIRNTMLIKAAVEFEIFTIIDDLEKQNQSTLEAIARKIKCPERSTRILLDALVVRNLLTKRRVGQVFHYYNTPMTAKFLNKNKDETYVGRVCDFILDDVFIQKRVKLVQAVKSDGIPYESSLMTINNEQWVKFAKAMQPIARKSAEVVYKYATKFITIDDSRPMRVLDISCSHAEYGLAFAKHSSKVTVYGVDFSNVIAVGIENAERLGLSNQFVAVPGDALAMDKYCEPGTIDVALIPNFLHHFSVDVNIETLQKCYEALKVGGLLCIVEFVPNEERTGSPEAVLFAINMLVGTEHGDAYTYNELLDMCQKAGFKNSKLHIKQNAFIGLPQSILCITKQ
jgi:SAM-dependent methyltransferase